MVIAANFNWQPLLVLVEFGYISLNFGLNYYNLIGKKITRKNSAIITYFSGENNGTKKPGCHMVY